MIQLTDDEIFILGRPNFTCGRIGRTLIEAGIYKNGGNKAEYEQAISIHWMLGLLKEHGENWRKVSGDLLVEYASKGDAKV